MNYLGYKSNFRKQRCIISGFIRHLMKYTFSKKLFICLKSLMVKKKKINKGLKCMSHNLFEESS